MTTQLTERSDRTRQDGEDSAAHLLRLCLDLQLDALLLTLGAASGTASNTQAHAMPWRRWLSEDVDLACTLAADVLAGRATLPTVLGTPLDRAVPTAVIDNLSARYQCMRDLLTGLLRRVAADHDPSDGEATPCDAWRPRIAEALERCELRLAELSAHHLAAAPSTARVAQYAGRPYLPGELLG